MVHATAVVGSWLGAVLLLAGLVYLDDRRLPPRAVAAGVRWVWWWGTVALLALVGVAWTAPR